MIFVTVGTQLPFDRMIKLIDQWAARRGRRDVFAQIGPTELRPQHIQWVPFLDADECRRRTAKADAVIAHAGMGTILTALELGKPIIIMPRRGDLHEHRNDHQIATAKQLLAQGRVAVAFTEDELIEKLDHLESVHAARRISPTASPRLIGMLQAFVHGEDVVAGLRRSIGAAMAGRPVKTEVADEPVRQKSDVPLRATPDPEKVTV